MSDRETQPGSIIPGVDWESGVKRLMGNEQLYRNCWRNSPRRMGMRQGGFVMP